MYVISMFNPETTAFKRVNTRAYSSRFDAIFDLYRLEEIPAKNWIIDRSMALTQHEGVEYFITYMPPVD